jgi:hypothetical protein
MSSDAIVIVGVGFQNSAQMHLAQDNDVVHTFTPDRSDQPFHKAILPGRGWCGRLVPDARGAQSARDDAAIDPVAIADEVMRSLIPGKCLRYLTCNPFGRRICCDVDPDEVSAVEPDNDEGIEQVETDSWNNEQVLGGDVRRVVTQEGPPSLTGRPPPFDHVLGDAGRRDLKPELEQFAVNAWCTPKRILHAHPPDQRAQLRVDLRSPSLGKMSATSRAGRAMAGGAMAPAAPHCERHGRACSGQRRSRTILRYQWIIRDPARLLFRPGRTAREPGVGGREMRLGHLAMPILLE